MKHSSTIAASWFLFLATISTSYAQTLQDLLINAASKAVMQAVQANGPPANTSESSGTQDTLNQRSYSSGPLSNFDVLGFRLGMNPAQAASLSKNRPGKYGPATEQYLVLKAEGSGGASPFQIPNGKFLTSIKNGAANVDTFGSDGTDLYHVGFSPIPGNEKAVAIYRQVGLAPGNRPLAEKLMVDLIAKYGKPSTSKIEIGQNTLIWAADANDHLLSASRPEQCGWVHFPVPGGGLSEPTSPEVSWRSSIKSDWRLNSDFRLTCGDKILSVEMSKDHATQVVSRINTVYVDLGAILTGQQAAFDLVNSSGKNARQATIEKAAKIQRPDL